MGGLRDVGIIIDKPTVGRGSVNGGTERSGHRAGPVWRWGMVAVALLIAPVAVAATPGASEQDAVAEWRAARVSELTGPEGWLTLEGLYWLREGDQTLGSDPGLAVSLRHPQMPRRAGTFTLRADKVSFRAERNANVRVGGTAVTTTAMAPDNEPVPTVLEIGSLRLFVIERSGRLGIRIRDVDSPRRREFRGLDYFPIDDAWNVSARFDAYDPPRKIQIVNVLGMEVDMVSPGAVVFDRDGSEWRLDALLDGSDESDLLLMFSDGTSGHESYGAGRFLHVERRTDGIVSVDFNKAYNPPCAFSVFATCPLPPPQNRISLRIEAGERKYGGTHH